MSTIKIVVVVVVEQRRRNIASSVTTFLTHEFVNHCTSLYIEQFICLFLYFFVNSSLQQSAFNLRVVHVL